MPCKNHKKLHVQKTGLKLTCHIGIVSYVRCMYVYVVYIYIHIMYLGDFSSEVRVKSCFLELHVSKAPPVRWDMLIQLDLIWFSPNSSEKSRIFFTKKILQVAGTILLGDDRRWSFTGWNQPFREEVLQKKIGTTLPMWKARGHQLAWNIASATGWVWMKILA